MKTQETIKLTFYVELFRDWSVGIMGGTETVTMDFPKHVWDGMDTDERTDTLNMLKFAIGNSIDPDGECLTEEEYNFRFSDDGDEASDSYLEGRKS